MCTYCLHIAYTLLTRLLTPAKCLCDCLSLLQGDYTAVENIFHGDEMIFMFPKKSKWKWNGSMVIWFYFDFWRNEKVNHLVKIISWCKQCVHLAWIHRRDITLWIECKQGCSVLYVCCMCVVYTLRTSCMHP